MSETDEDTDKNGGPNHLSAWMRFRKLKGVDLAKALDVTPGMVSDLANSKRALSAKWLRRLAGPLRTTPGMLLDNDPFALDKDLIEIWVEASLDQRKTLAQLANVVVKGGAGAKTGTDGK